MKNTKHRETCVKPTCNERTPRTAKNWKCSSIIRGKETAAAEDSVDNSFKGFLAQNLKGPRISVLI